MSRPYAWRVLACLPILKGQADLEDADGEENDDDTDLRDMMADKDNGISWCHSVGV